VGGGGDGSIYLKLLKHGERGGEKEFFLVDVEEEKGGEGQQGIHIGARIGKRKKELFFSFRRGGGGKGRFGGW